MRRRMKIEPISEKVDYPSGTFIHTEKGYFYVASKAKRYRITSKRVLSSWAPQRVAEVKESAVSHLKIAAKMKFRNGSLIWNLADGKLYLIDSGKRRWVKNPAWFYYLNIETDRHSYPKGVSVVSDDEIKLHELGEDLN